MADEFVQQDLFSRFALEDGSGFLLLEAQSTTTYLLQFDGAGRFTLASGLGFLVLGTPSTASSFIRFVIRRHSRLKARTF